MTAAVWGVQVNEVAVMMCGGSDAERWTYWRVRFERIGRVATLRVEIPGDVVHVACESRGDAAELAALWHESGMVHKSAAKVRRLRQSDVSAEEWATVTGCLERLRARHGQADGPVTS